MDVYGIEALLDLPEFRVIDQVIGPHQLDLHLERREDHLVCPHCQTCCSRVKESRPYCSGAPCAWSIHQCRWLFRVCVGVRHGSFQRSSETRCVRRARSDERVFCTDTRQGIPSAPGYKGAPSTSCVPRRSRTMRTASEPRHDLVGASTFKRRDRLPFV